MTREGKGNKILSAFYLSCTLQGIIYIYLIEFTGKISNLHIRKQVELT